MSGLRRCCESHACSIIHHRNCCTAEFTRTGSRRHRCAAPRADASARPRPWEARPTRVGPTPQLAAHQSGLPGHAAGAGGFHLPRRSSVQLPGGASRESRYARVAVRSAAPTLDPPPTRKGSAPMRKLEQSSNRLVSSGRGVGSLTWH